MKKRENNQMEIIQISLELPNKLVRHLTYLESVSKRDKAFILREAFIQYLEDAKDISTLEEWAKRKDKKYYSSEEIDHLLEQKGLKKISV